MDAFSYEINDLLVSLYTSIEKMEQQMLTSAKNFDLSIREIHFLDAVGRDKEQFPLGKTISELAECLGITLPSVTLAVNKLQKKGFLVKERSVSDGRIVHIHLTREGQKVYRLHRLFHTRMVNAVAAELSQEEKNALTSGVRKMRNFFADTLAAQAREGR